MYTYIMCLIPCTVSQLLLKAFKQCSIHDDILTYMPSIDIRAVPRTCLRKCFFFSPIVGTWTERKRALMTDLNVCVESDTAKMETDTKEHVASAGV